jgi:CMP/dCMP kinase
MSVVPVITIDGPSASGKGTVAVLVAKTLAWYFLDSGALYRWVAFWAKEEKLSVGIEGVSSLVDLIEKKKEFFSEGQYLDPRIRTVEVSLLASRIAIYPAVREALVPVQKSFVRAPGLVADGRDMGTVIFPDAFLKVYLDASVAVRAERAHIAETLLEERDHRDRKRFCAPLLQANDAVYIDTTTLSVTQVVDRVVACIHTREKGKAINRS